MTSFVLNKTKKIMDMMKKHWSIDRLMKNGVNSSPYFSLFCSMFKSNKT